MATTSEKLREVDAVLMTYHPEIVRLASVEAADVIDALEAALSGLVAELRREMPDARDSDKGTAWLAADEALTLARKG